jgi:hypothetical protein
MEDRACFPDDSVSGVYSLTASMNPRTGINTRLRPLHPIGGAPVKVAVWFGKGVSTAYQKVDVDEDLLGRRSQIQ